MDPLDKVAEQRIADAIAAGEFDALPGLGKPLELEDLSLVDPELRASYVLLRSANVLPEELSLRKELVTLGDLVRACEDPGERASLEDRRRAIALRYGILMERRRRGG
jgi:hypothetical protein